MCTEFILLSLILNYFCYRSLWVFLISMPIGLVYMKWRINEKKIRRKRILNYHFKDALRGLETAVRAGYSMEQSVRECRKELEQIYENDADIVKEFRYMEQQMRVGVPIEQLFIDFGNRSGVEDIRNFGEIYLITRRSGGNLGKIMERMSKVIGDKIQVNKEIQTNLAGRKMEQMVMSVVPGGMILYIQLTSKGIMDVMYHNLLGVIVMTVCLGMYFFSVFLAGKIVRISV